MVIFHSYVSLPEGKGLMDGDIVFEYRHRIIGWTQYDQYGSVLSLIALSHGSPH